MSAITVGDLRETELNLRADLRQTELRLQLEIEKVRADLRVEIKNVQYTMIKWLVGTVLATGFALAGFIAKGMGWL